MGWLQVSHPLDMFSSQLMHKMKKIIKLAIPSHYTDAMFTSLVQPTTGKQFYNN